MDNNNHPEGNAPDQPDDNDRADHPVDDQQNDKQADKRRKPRIVAFDVVGFFGDDLLVIEEEEF